VAIGDVATAVDDGSPIDKHAQAQTQTIYTAVKNFPMLPLELFDRVDEPERERRPAGGDDELYRGPDGAMSDEACRWRW